VAERIYETLWRMVGRLMDCFQVGECLNFFIQVVLLAKR
jgi:hypothetical protein